MLAERTNIYFEPVKSIGLYVYNIENDSWNVNYFEDCNLGN